MRFYLGLDFGTSGARAIAIDEEETPCSEVRELLQPSGMAWWWPKPALSKWERYNWFWNALTTVFFTASPSLFVKTSSQFLSGGIGFIGATSIVGQTVLTLLASKGALTTAGEETIKQTIERFHIPKSKGGAARTLISVMLFSGLALFGESRKRDRTV